MIFFCNCIIFWDLNYHFIHDLHCYHYYYHYEWHQLNILWCFTICQPSTLLLSKKWKAIHLPVSQYGLLSTHIWLPVKNFKHFLSVSVSIRNSTSSIISRSHVIIVLVAFESIQNSLNGKKLPTPWLVRMLLVCSAVEEKFQVLSSIFVLFSSGGRINPGNWNSTVINNEIYNSRILNEKIWLLSLLKIVYVYNYQW